MSDDRLHRYNVTLAGNEQSDRSIVFVHGLGTSQAAWKQVAEPFLGEFRQILFDLAGATPSSRDHFLAHQSRYLDSAGYVDDLLDLCQALELRQPAIFVGHSLGAMVCLLASIQRPELFEKIVLIGGSPCYLNVGNYRGGMEQKDIDAIYQAISGDYLGWTSRFAPVAMGNPQRPQLTKHFAESLASIPREMMLTVLCSILQADHRHKMQEVTARTLVIQSGHDALVPPEVADFLHGAIADSQLEIIDATGHLPHLSAPAEVIGAIRAFIC